MSSRFELFMRYPLFDRLDFDELFTLLTNISLDFLTFPTGEIILEKEAETKSLYFLISGKVQVEGPDENSKIVDQPELLTFTHVFGSNTASPVRITSLEESSLMLIPKSAMLHMFQSNRKVLENFLNMFSDYYNPPTTNVEGDSLY